MSASLRQTLSKLAASFAADVLGMIRNAPLEDLLAGAPGSNRAVAPALAAHASALPELGNSPLLRRRGGRLPRRSSGDIEHVIESIVVLLKQSPSGLRAEQIRESLGLQAKELPRPLKEGLKAGKLAKSGQKRATTYFAKGAAGAPVRAAKTAPSRGRRRGRSGRGPAGRVAARPARGGRRAKRGK